MLKNVIFVVDGWNPLIVMGLSVYWDLAMVVVLSSVMLLG